MSSPSQGGRTLGQPWGKPYGRRRPWGRSDLRDPLARALAALGLAVAIWGVMTAAMGIPEPGIFGDSSGGLVREVLPGGPAWHSGIRQGQAVVEITSGESALDWVLHARGSGIDHFVTVRNATAELRGTTPLALVALLAALVAVAAAFRRPRPAAAAASLAGAVGAVPLMFAGNPVISSIGGLLMFGLPVGWLVAVRLRHGALRVVVLAVALLVALGWLLARFAASTVYDPVEAGRLVASIAAALAVAGLSLDREALRRAFGSLGAPMVLDLLGLAIAGGLTLSLWLVAGVPPALIAASLTMAAVIYLRSRRPVVRALDRLLFGERLERASVAAIESERGRMSREIHDSSLQELSGVIRRLEANSAVSSEASTLRAVASQLRAVATDLQPPVLDDLGLGPALEFLAQQANASGSTVRVEVAVRDHTAIAKAARLPADVELAIFRMVQQAVSNAQAHCGGTIVEISGELTPDRVDLAVRDDGVGIDERALRDARQRGRLGLSSMRQRAASIGAECSLTAASPHGTAVLIHWRRP